MQISCSRPCAGGSDRCGSSARRVVLRLREPLISFAPGWLTKRVNQSQRNIETSPDFAIMLFRATPPCSASAPRRDTQPTSSALQARRGEEVLAVDKEHHRAAVQAGSCRASCRRSADSDVEVPDVLELPAGKSCGSRTLRRLSVGLSGVKPPPTIWVTLKRHHDRVERGGRAASLFAFGSGRDGKRVYLRSSRTGS